jgi:hypothetical protein
VKSVLIYKDESWNRLSKELFKQVEAENVLFVKELELEFLNFEEDQTTFLKLIMYEHNEL